VTAAAFAGLDPCVHCGFCLQSCPTYVATSDEADSPRGRIVLLQALACGQLHADEPMLAYHLDRCLGCRACEPACPSGVSYGPALEAGRAMLGRTRPVPWSAKAVNAIMADPLIRRPVLGATRLVRPIAGFMLGTSRFGLALGMLAATRPTRSTGPIGTPRRAEPTARSTIGPPVALFTGCIMEGLLRHVHGATERTLRTNGYALQGVPAQACCGALHAHTGDHERAVRLARENTAAFAGHPDTLVAVNSAGCGAMLREYGSLLAGDPLEDAARELGTRVRDVTELLAERGPLSGSPMQLRVAYDPPCHLLHAQRVAAPPIQVLDAVPKLERVTHADAEMCCGSAGSYSLTEPELSRAVLDPKLDALLAADPDVVATGNPGCIMQLGAGLAARGAHIPVVHPVEILDWSYHGAGLYDTETPHA
jgi:glycolate oxidase iron-sulfur subunit